MPRSGSHGLPRHTGASGGLKHPAGHAERFINVIQVFLYILASISEGLQALGGNLNYFTGTGTKLDLPAFNSQDFDCFA